MVPQPKPSALTGSNWGQLTCRFALTFSFFEWSCVCMFNGPGEQLFTLFTHKGRTSSVSACSHEHITHSMYSYEGVSGDQQHNNSLSHVCPTEDRGRREQNVLPTGSGHRNTTAVLNTALHVRYMPLFPGIRLGGWHFYCYSLWSTQYQEPGTRVISGVIQFEACWRSQHPRRPRRVWKSPCIGPRYAIRARIPDERSGVKQQLGPQTRGSTSQGDTDWCAQRGKGIEGWHRGGELMEGEQQWAEHRS